MLSLRPVVDGLHLGVCFLAPNGLGLGGRGDVRRADGLQCELFGPLESDEGAFTREPQ